MMTQSQTIQSKPSSSLTFGPNKIFKRQRVLFAAVIFCLGLAGCGGKMNQSGPGTPIPGQNTKVTVLLSSTANARISAFQLVLSSVTLHSKTSNSVTLLQLPLSPSPSQAFVETIHTNGDAEPLGTVTIPQDIYTSASVTVAGARFTFVTFDAGNKTLTYNTDSITGTLQSAAVLPSPVTISGDAMTLTLDLQVSKSASFTGPAPFGTYTITPTFNITPVTVKPQPTNNQNGKASGIHGRIASLSSAGFNLALPDGPTLTVTSDSNTAFQGIGAFSALSAGMFVNIDTAIQSDGSLRATRVEVEDLNAHDVMIGPLSDVESTVSDISVMDLQQQGDDFCCAPDPAGHPFHLDTSTVFRISGQLGNLQNLPFNPSFTAQNLVQGQNVSVASATFLNSGGPFTTATTVTLVPQTLNGTVTAVSTDGSFTVYTLALAPNDLIPTLTGINSVVAYVGSTTQLTNSSSISSGSVVRFSGLLLNDSGTLRMVAVQVSDGVTP
jgi:hypothetical protein